jgi:hypothetical protein
MVLNQVGEVIIFIKQLFGLCLSCSGLIDRVCLRATKVFNQMTLSYYSDILALSS